MSHKCRFTIRVASPLLGDLGLDLGILLEGRLEDAAGGLPPGLEVLMDEGASAGARHRALAELAVETARIQEEILEAEAAEEGDGEPDPRVELLRGFRAHLEGLLEEGP